MFKGLGHPFSSPLSSSIIVGISTDWKLCPLYYRPTSVHLDIRSLRPVSCQLYFRPLLINQSEAFCFCYSKNCSRVVRFWLWSTAKALKQYTAKSLIRLSAISAATTRTASPPIFEIHCDIRINGKNRFCGEFEKMAKIGSFILHI